ncbi:THUMP domain-containing protein 2-like [Microcaecilia unicolor]|uniref:THUMP domain-containing protein 2-like n=1 Tax=Microcaecilia unicolor TaxID=1415580 RepID=A0A6P7XIM7_9AMPH|nr:THUMP domain-containing protein 2-like [Microcaecilia unicolor]
MVPAAPARYFCTSGKGMEHFVAQEVKNKLAAEKVEHVSGKVFFTTNSDLCKLQNLKSAERLFLLLKKLPPLSLPENKGRGLYKIKQYVIGDPCCWLDALSVWQNLQGKGFKEENPLFLKRNAEHAQTSLAPKKRKEDTTYVEAEDYHLENQIVSPLLVGREDDGKNNKQTFPGVPAQNQKEKPIADVKEHYISFRVSCRCSGTVAKRFTAQEVGRIVGIGLIKEFGWKADLRNPYLEIFVHLNDSYCVVGFPVLRHPLASREYIQRPGLRSTVAWAMASLAEINSGAFVLDPMCGFGTILMEAAKEWPVNTFASKVAATQDQYADASIGNVTGSNAVNVFLGIGVAWSIAAIYHAAHGEEFNVHPGTLAFSVTLFTIFAFINVGVLLYRRRPEIGGELGGPRTAKLLTTALFTLLWLLYILFSSLEAYCHIKGF